MKSKLFFRHNKHNILKYTVAFSAAVHLIGFILFPSWGTSPVLVNEKIITIRAVVEKPAKPVEEKLPESEKKKEREISKPIKEPEPITQKIRKKSPMVKSTKTVTPSSAEKRTPVSIHHSKQNFQSVKAIQRSASIPHPVTGLHKMAEMKIPSKLPPSLLREKTETSLVASSNTLMERQPMKSYLDAGQVNNHRSISRVAHDSEIPSSHSTVQRKFFTKVAIADPTGTPSPTFTNPQGNIAASKTVSVKISSPSRLDENIYNQSPALKVKFARGNKGFKANPIIRAQNIQPLMNQGTPAASSRRESFASMIVSGPTTEIKARVLQNFDSKISPATQRATAVAGRYSTFTSIPTSLLQTASIPSGFSEKTIDGFGETKDNKPSGKNNSTDGTDEISADQIGKIKKAFSSQVWTKIAQSKYYPRIARKRGFEGEPVVAFTIGNAGNLLDVSIENGSTYKLLDEAAVDAVKSASPYPPIPGLLKMKTIKFKLPISFILEGP